MAAANGGDNWVGVARETFECGMVPWVGRKYEGWLRAWARPHPVDPGQILVPERVSRVYNNHLFREPVTRQELEAMGYPRTPPAEEPHAAGPARPAA